MVDVKQRQLAYESALVVRRVKEHVERRIRIVGITDGFCPRTPEICGRYLNEKVVCDGDPSVHYAAPIDAVRSARKAIFG